MRVDVLRELVECSALNCHAGIGEKGGMIPRDYELVPRKKGGRGKVRTRKEKKGI